VFYASGISIDTAAEGDVTALSSAGNSSCIVLVASRPIQQFALSCKGCGPTGAEPAMHYCLVLTIAEHKQNYKNKIFTAMNGLCADMPIGNYPPAL